MNILQASDVTRDPPRTFKRSSINSGLGVGNSKFIREQVIGKYQEYPKSSGLSGEDGSYILQTVYGVSSGEAPSQEVEFIRIFEDVPSNSIWVTTQQALDGIREGGRYTHIFNDNWLCLQAPL